MGIFRSNDPTTWDDVDGIIIDESAPAPNIAGVAANIGILVGTAQRGPAEIQEPGSIGAFHEMYGKSNFGLNRELKNKQFGRLRLIRVVASDAAVASKSFQSSAANRITFSAKQGKGAYGNNIQVKIEEASSSRQETHTVECVADVAGSLDGLYFVLPDADGTVAFWIDVGDGGGSAPEHGADRAVEITTIESGDSASVVAAKVAAAINNDSAFTATAVGAVVTVVAVDYAPHEDDASEGDSGFTITKTQEGVYAGKKYTIRDANLGAVLPQEVYDNVKIVEITSSTFGGSQLVTAVVDSASAEPSNAAFTSLESGSDGTVTDSDYEAAIAKAAVERAGNFIALDEYNATRRGYLVQHAAETQDKMVILAGPEVQSVSEYLTDLANYRDTDGRIMYVYPWVETRIDGVLTYTSPASWALSVLTQTAPNVDPAASSNAKFLQGITSLKVNLTRANYINIKDAGGMALERDEDIGFKFKSGIVTQIADSSKVTVTRRRMADFLTNSAALFLKNYQNAVNSKENRTAVKAAILAFVTSLENVGILPKDSEVPDGLAKLIDTESLNTANSIAQGYFRILWRQRIYSSMRYIVISAEIGESVVVTEQAV